MEYALEIEDLRVSLKSSVFGKQKEILKGISLKVPRNQIFGFLGPNGAGKTTTIKTILGLIPFFKGKVSLFGQAIGSPQLRARIGCAPEHAYFSQYLTPHEVLLSLGTLSGLDAATIKQRSAHWLEILELSHVVNQPIKTFSKGMKQRLALVQALLHDPDFIIFDEPGTGLDPIGQREIKNLMLELKQQQKTVFVSSHHLLDAQQFCDHICILKEGAVAVNGSLSQLLPENTNLEQFFVQTVGEVLA